MPQEKYQQIRTILAKKSQRKRKRRLDSFENNQTLTGIRVSPEMSRIILRDIPQTSLNKIKNL